MAPRKYNLGKRAQSVDETRRRIVEAIVALHREQGVADTTHEDIARRADVAVATVYRHFPTVGDAVPACGAHILELTQPPTPADVLAAASPEERLARTLEAIFSFWGRIAPWQEKALCDAAKVPALAESVRQGNEYHRAIVTMALGELSGGDDDVRMATALSGFYAWKAFHDQGLEGQAAEIVTKALLGRLTGAGAREKKEER